MSISGVCFFPFKRGLLGDLDFLGDYSSLDFFIGVKMGMFTPTFYVNQ